MILGVSVRYIEAFNQGAPLVSYSEWDAEISELNKILKELQKKKKKLVKESDRLAEKILKEKRKSPRRSSRKLEVMLRESQQLILNLEPVSKQIMENVEKLKQKYSMAITGLVTELEKKSKEKKKKKLLKYLLKYIGALESIKEPIQFQMPEINLEVQKNDSPDDILQKADFLSDQTSLLKAKMFQIDENIRQLKTEKKLRNKIRKFTDEINFFDTTLIVEERKVVQMKSNTQDQKNENQEPPPSLPDDAEPPPMPNTEAPPPMTDDLDTSSPPTFGDSVPSSAPASEDVGASEAPMFVEVTSQEPSFIIQREVSDGSPADLIFSNSLDKQIDLLKQQKLLLGKQVQQLSEKTQNFYKRAKEVGF